MIGKIKLPVVPHVDKGTIHHVRCKHGTKAAQAVEGYVKRTVVGSLDTCMLEFKLRGGKVTELDNMGNVIDGKVTKKV